MTHISYQRYTYDKEVVHALYDLESDLVSTIKMLKEVPTKYENNLKQINWCELARIDYLHKLRDDSLNAIQLIQITKQIKENELVRKQAKEENILLKDIYQFCQNHSDIKFKLDEVLGATRKSKKYLDSEKTYKPKTLKVSNI